MRLVSVCLTIVVLGILLSNPINSEVLTNASVTTRESLHFSREGLEEYDVIDPIIITSERTFGMTGWSGSGTIEDPYLLERVHIISNGEGPYYDAARISDVDCHFVIRDCIISSINQGSGFRFSNLVHATIINCLFDCTGLSMNMFNCNGTKILNNSINCRDGIVIEVGENVEISSNYVRGGQSGIRSEALHNVTISDNTVIYCDYGIHHLGANGTITDNIIAGCEDIGIWIEDRWGNNMIYGNQIGYCGEYNAKDGSLENNLWDDNESIGNSWSDLGDNTTYSIPGEAGSIDRYPSEFTIDILGPVINLEANLMYEHVLDAPDNSFTFRASVSDISEVDTVLLYTKYRDDETAIWTVHEMEIVEPTSTYPYQCTVSGFRTGNIDFYVWANDTLGNWDISSTRVVWLEIPGQRLFILILPSIIFCVAVGSVVIMREIIKRRNNRTIETSENLVTLHNS